MSSLILLHFIVCNRYGIIVFNIPLNTLQVILETILRVTCRATGNSHFEMTKFPPPRQRKNSRKFPFPKLTVFVGIHGTKKLSDKPTGIYCECQRCWGITYRPILESRREWNRSIPGCQTRSSLMSNTVCVVCPRGVFFLGLFGASWAYLVSDLHGWYSAVPMLRVSFIKAIG